MKVSVRDAATLQTVRPLEVAAYLRASGWQQEADLNGSAGVWTKLGLDQQVHDLTLPLRQDFADFATRMAEVLRTLADVEKRSELEILRDLATIAADLIRVRALGVTADDGTLPLEEAVKFVEHSRNLLLAAACAAIEKKAFYAKRKPDQAMDYLARVRMGQTEWGSYVLTILSPVPPELHQSDMLPLQFEEVEPFERKVTRTLVNALTAMSTAAARAITSGDMEPFMAAVPSGLSANLCEAIVGAAAVSSGGGIDIEVSWSRARPTKEIGAPPRIRVGKDYVSVIEEAARLFRQTASIEDFELEGLVVRLNRGPTAANGDVTILAYVDGHWRNVVVELGDASYSKAVQAHDQRIAVTCVGDLAKEGRNFRLLNPRHFELRIESGRD